MGGYLGPGVTTQIDGYTQSQTDAKLTPTNVSDKSNSSTGALDLPSGTTAQRPSSPNTGYIRYNTDLGTIEFYNGSSWVATNLIPSVTSVSGNIYAGATSSITVNLSGYTDMVTLRFSKSGIVLADVTNLFVSAGAISTSVPSAVYSTISNGDTISLFVLNSDGTPSSNSQTKNAIGIPTGGSVSTSGNYRVHTFSSSGTFQTFGALTVDYLAVAGGGGGSQGGGGAGGHLPISSASLSVGSYSVIVGAGGSGQQNTRAYAGGDGSNSSFNSSIAIGGGGGGAYGDEGVAVRNGRAGGSGGGGGGLFTNQTYTPGGSSTAGQGSAGGYSEDLVNGRAGGGGGAGSAGQNGGSGAAGGSGLASSITGTSTYRAGGGGGGASVSGIPGTGGVGGGGNGGKYQTSNSTAGSVNTGGGGGGGSADMNGGSAGGSGVVVIRYQLT
jgi:hypothetical protein